MGGFITTLQGDPLFAIEPHGAPRNREFQIRGDSATYKSGSKSVLVNANAPQPEKREFDFLCMNREEIRQVRDFFLARVGQYEPFWMPTWQWEMEIGDYWAFFGSRTISVPSYLEYADKFFPLGNAYRALAFVYGNKATLFKVGAVGTGSPPPGYDTLQLTYEESYNGGISLSMPWTEARNVRPLWLRWVRFATDDLPREYRADGCANIHLSVMDVPLEAE